VSGPSTGGASICSIPFLSIRVQLKILAHPLSFTRRPITLRNHIPKIVFSWVSGHINAGQLIAGQLNAES